MKAFFTPDHKTDFFNSLSDSSVNRQFGEKLECSLRPEQQMPISANQENL